METERKEMTSAWMVNSKCSNCSSVLRLHLPVPEVLAKVREENVKLAQMVQKLTVEKAQLDAQLEAVKEVKLKEQKEKKQAREKRKKKSMEKQVQKGKTRPKGQTTLDGMGWVKQVAKLDRSKTVEGSEKKRLGEESLVNKASEGASGKASKPAAEGAGTSVQKGEDGENLENLQRPQKRRAASETRENLLISHQKQHKMSLTIIESGLSHSLEALKQYIASSAEDKDPQPPTEKIPKVEKQEYFEDNQIKREPVDHAHSAELDNFDQQKCPKQK